MVLRFRKLSTKYLVQTVRDLVPREQSTVVQVQHIASTVVQVQHIAYKPTMHRIHFLLECIRFLLECIRFLLEYCRPLAYFRLLEDSVRTVRTLLHCQAIRFHQTPRFHQTHRLLARIPRIAASENPVA
jgi:hypothetical protein